MKIKVAHYRTTVCPDCFGTGYTGSECDHNPCDLCKTSGKVKPYFNSPDYSTDAAAAMLVLEKCMDEVNCSTIQIRLREDDFYEIDFNCQVRSSESSFARAICLFARKLFASPNAVNDKTK